MTSSQRALWLYQQAHPGSAAYHIGGALRLQGAVDPARLDRALGRMLQRHPILRTTFPAEEGEPRCVIVRAPPHGALKVDSIGQPADATCAAFVQKDSLDPFDLERGPLVRFRLVSMAPDVHLFIAVVHHIVADLGSFSLLLRDLPDLYDESAGPTRAQTGSSWTAFAEWQAGLAESPAGRRELEFWRQALPAPLPFLDFGPGGTTSTLPARQLRRPLAAESVRIIDGLAQSTGTSAHAALLAAWAAVLARHTGQREIVLAVPRPLRSRTRFPDLVGYLINTVLLPIVIQDGEPFRALVSRVAGILRRSMAHGLVPFPEVAKHLGLSNQPGASIFQNMVAWYPEDQEAGALAVPGTGKTFRWGPWEMTPEPLASVEAHCDVLLLAAPQGAEICCEVRHAPSAQAFAADALSQMERLLAHAAASPDAPHTDFRLISPHDAALLARWNATSLTYDAPSLLHACVAEQAARTPQVRLTDGEAEIRLDELDAQSDRLARRLAGLGVRPGARVGIVLRPTLRRIAAMLGILKAGAAFVPLDHAAAPSRLPGLVRAADPALLVVEEDQNEIALSELADVPVVSIGEVLIEDGGGPEGDPPSDLDPQTIAYVLFTSGSSGQPKGVMVSHAAISNRILWMRDAFPLAPNDCVLHKTPLTFDVSLWEVFLPLVAGARLFVAPDEAQRDPRLLAGLIARHEVTMAHFVPTILRAFLEGLRPGECPTLRCVVASGEALDARICDEFFARLPQASLHNLYGPTEAAVDVSAWQCAPGWQEPVPIGTPIANVRLHVLDDKGRQVPIGAPGELFIEGVGLAAGYLMRPDLTAERFRVITVDGIGCRAYATGDLARYRADGALEFLGRRDRQMKIAGGRVELEGIEAHLLAHPAVREAAVVAVPVDGVPQLRAFVVTRDEASDEDLRTHLAGRLPPLAIPSRFERVPRLPRLTSGKVDTRAVSAWAANLGAAGQPLPSSGDPREAALQRAWSKVLGIPLPDRDANFFGLGGDSIRMVQIQAELSKTGWTFRVQDFARHPTIRALAPILTDLEPEDAARPFDLLEPEEQAGLAGRCLDAYPLAAVQQSLLFHSRYEAAYEVYTTAFCFSGPFDRRRLEEAAVRLHERHGLLRASYVYTSRLRFVQAVSPSVRIDLSVVDVRELDAPVRAASLLDWLAAERRRAFDWSAAPLFRLTVHLLEQRLFQLTISHPFFDGWSVANLLGELMVDYDASLTGELRAIEPPRVTYRDFVGLELRASRNPESRAFWEQRVDGALPALPAHAHTGGGETRRPRRLTSEVPGNVTGRLRELAARTGVPLKSFLLAVHLRVLALLAGRTDVITALLTNGRLERPDGDRIAGMFLNPVPLRMDVDGLDWLGLATAAWQAEQDILPHRRYPFAGMGAPAHRVLDSAFNYVHLHTLERLARLRSVRLHEWQSPTDQTFFPMTAYFHLETGAERLLFHLDTFGDVVSEELGERIAGYYQRGLAAFAEMPEAEPRNEDLLSAREVQLQLRDWNRTERRWPTEHDQPVPRLFASVAARSPQARCLTFRGESLSYEQVAALVDQLASALRTRGIGASDLVGLLVEPGPGWAIGVLGILSAGAAFLPLDPASPPARLQWMLEDAHVRTVVTDDEPAARATFAGAEIVPIDLRSESRAPENPVGMDAIDADSLAYVIYTSGSTGTPKGVEVTHSSLTNVLLAFQESTCFGAGDTLLSVSPSTFDISILELLLPMVCGGHLVIAGRDLRTDPVLLLEEMAREGPTLMQATPSTWRLLVEAGWNGDPRLSILCGGDVLPRPLADALLSRCARLWNVYGPTEATIWCTFEQVTGGPDAPTIGRPLANVQAYLLGPRLDLLPVGTVGSLYIGGRAVARGYRNGDASAWPRFLPDPFGKDGGRLHRTGDQARLTPDGRIELLGRSDDQVKRSGMRVHLSEVERALERLPGIAAAAVLVRRESPGALEACIVVRGTEDVVDSDLRKQLAELLPAWMIPARFHRVAALPWTAHGKLNRAELERVAKSASAGTDDRRHHVEPASPRDQAIAEVVGAILEVERISLSARFDALGADSLKMLRLLHALESRGLTELTLPELMSCATVADLAVRLERSPDPPQACERGLRRRAALRSLRRTRENRDQ